MNLSKISIEFAKNHIRKYYDSSFFVKPFEFDAIWANWPEVEQYLLNTEINSFPIESPIAIAIPKPKGGFRIVHQLDPINSLIYTALVYEVAEHIENSRIPNEAYVACSYRVKTQMDGSFFSNETEYEKFYSRCLELSGKYSHVLVTDITDFYNQIYLHRLQNSIESCNSGLSEISKEIETFLSKINGGPSKGIPVGPAPSIVLAEAVLIDIDEFIINKEVEYTRYVDDIRIFANSKLKLMCLLEELSHYLYDAHRLTLSSSKTQIIESPKFSDSYLLDSETKEKREIHKALEKLDIKLNGYYPVLDTSENFDKLPSDSKIKVQAEALNNLLLEIINQGHLDLGLARHILRRAKKLRSRALLTNIFEHFDLFSPVTRDLFLYLNEITSSSMVKHNLPKIEKIIKTAETVHLSCVRYWMEFYFSRTPFFNNSKIVKSFMDSSKNIRNRALFAKTNKEISYVRSKQKNISNLGPWDRRAVLYASTVLSKDERMHWMSLVEQTTNSILERVLARYMKTF